MSLIIVEVVEEGILFSADKRITCVDNNTYEDNCTKAFPLKGRIVGGVVGRNVDNPDVYRNELDGQPDNLADKTVYDCAK